jgi:hypothetical protein
MNLVLTPPLLGFVVGTRAALAFGLGLLLADRIPPSRRRSVGLMAGSPHHACAFRSSSSALATSSRAVFSSRWVPCGRDRVRDSADRSTDRALTRTNSPRVSGVRNVRIPNHHSSGVQSAPLHNT